MRRLRGPRDWWVVVVLTGQCSLYWIQLKKYKNKQRQHPARTDLPNGFSTGAHLWAVGCGSGCRDLGVLKMGAGNFQIYKNNPIF